MSLKRNMVFGIVGLLIPIFVLLYAVVYITLEKNMYHNAADSLEKLSVEAQIYTMNYLEKEAEVDTLGPNSLLIASYLAKRMDVRVQMIGKNGDVVADTQKGALLHRNIDIESSLKGRSLTFLRRRIQLLFFCFQARFIMETMSLEVFVL